MTPTEWIMLSDRLVAVCCAGAVAFLLCRFPWARMWNWLASVKPVVIDGGLAGCIAMFLMAQTVFSSDDAYKYCNPWLLFWLKAFFGIAGAGFGALKAFRGTEYARHRGMENAPAGTEPPKIVPTVEPTTNAEIKTP